MGLVLGFIDSEESEIKAFSLITRHMACRQGGQAQGAGCVLFRLSLGVVFFFFFSLSLFQSFFPIRPFHPEVFIPYMVISIWIAERCLG